MYDGHLWEIESRIARGMFPPSLLHDKQDLITAKLICYLRLIVQLNYIFSERKVKRVIWPCKWPKYLTSDANCTKSLSLIAPVIIYHYPIQASVSQHFSKEGL